MMRQAYSNRGGGGGSRLIIGAVIAVFALISYFSSTQFNPITGETQHLSLTTDQEIALGLQSAPEMIQEFGGLASNQSDQNLVDQIGFTIVQNSMASGTPWRFEYSVLRDPETVNAFALPGGPIFITEGLLSRLSTEDQVAGVLAHETVHVLARHSAQQIAKSDLTNGLVGAIGVASGDASAAQTAAMVGQLINLRYGRADETQADKLGVCLMMQAGYDPQGMVELMQVLQSLGGSGQPEFLSTHPDPGNRLQEIRAVITDPGSTCPQ